MESGRKLKHCVYCGDIATDREHVVPVSYTSIVRNYKKGSTVPACRHCNATLGNKHLLTIDERAMHVYHKIYNSRKFAKILKTPRWEEGELNEFSENMAEFLRSQFEARKWLEARLDNLELVSEGYEAKPLINYFTRQYEAIYSDMLSGESD